jgi:hypothetical protein
MKIIGCGERKIAMWATYTEIRYVNVSLQNEWTTQSYIMEGQRQAHRDTKGS